MDTFELLKNAYSDTSFIDKIQIQRLDIESELSKFVNEVRRNIKVFENLESRVKSLNSFCEKIKRKDYITTWKISDNKEENQLYILSHLPDIIGFRINCFFYEDEIKIYNELKNYYESRRFPDSYELDFSENTKQKNGHDLYKVSGKNGSTNFEIQIKCSVHNIWGEVEHRRIYKSEHFDPKVKSKKIITEEVFKILKSSDEQLKTIFEEEYSEDELIKSLFYQFTNKNIIKQENTTILSNHYKHFFDIFNKKEDMKSIKRFVSKKLVNEDFEKSKLTFKEPSVMNIDEFKSRYIPFDIKIVHEIACQLYEDLDFDDFIAYLISTIEVLAYGSDEFDELTDVFDEKDESDGENDNENMETDVRNSIFAKYDTNFEKREDK